MMTFEKVLEVFNDYLNKDSVLEVVNTKRGYTVMIWDEKDEQWFGVEHCKAPELLRDALLDGYRDFLEQQLMLYPKLGEKARNNGHVVYSLDFEVTPHQLRHTYITNLIHSSVDPKTVQYLAGHESSKITMDIYAKVKYNRPDDLVKAMGCAFDLWDAV